MSRATPGAPAQQRSTQAERRARSRSALLESAARGLSRYGYGNLVLEQVAREAGYSRGALYHQFEDKEDLALAVIEWVNENWMREVGGPAKQEPDPVAELVALARGHAVFCRRDIARVVMALRVEFSGHDHPVGRKIERISETGAKRAVRLIDAGRQRRVDSTGSARQGGCLGVLGSPRGRRHSTGGSSPTRRRARRAGRPRGARGSGRVRPPALALRQSAQPPEEDLQRLAVEIFGDEIRLEELLQRRLSDNFLFSAPPDPELDRDGYFERCWPGAGRGQDFDFVRIIESGDEVVVTNEANVSGGARGRTRGHHLR